MPGWLMKQYCILFMNCTLHEQLCPMGGHNNSIQHLESGSSLGSPRIPGVKEYHKKRGNAPVPTALSGETKTSVSSSYLSVLP